MKLSLPLAILAFSSFLQNPVFSQSGEGKIEYQKGDKVAAVIELPYSYMIVEGGIKEFMEKKGGTNSRSKGFEVYRSTHALDGELCDIHCKVDRKIESNRESSVIYMLIGRPGENIAARPSTDHFKVDEAKELLNKLASSIDGYSLEVQIKKQEEQVKKAEKRLLSLKDDEYELERKIKALQDKLALNKNDQMVQTEELNKQKDALNVIVNKKEITQGGAQGAATTSTN
jgi:hypothetical protein